MSATSKNSRLDIEAHFASLEIHAEIRNGSPFAVQCEWVSQFKAPKSPDYSPTIQTVQSWLKTYTPECIIEGIRLAAEAYKRGALDDLSDTTEAMYGAIRYASGCMKGIKANSEKGGAR